MDANDLLHQFNFTFVFQISATSNKICLMRWVPYMLLFSSWASKILHPCSLLWLLNELSSTEKELLECIQPCHMHLHR